MTTGKTTKVVDNLIKCEWYDKELEGVSWNYPFCCSQHIKDSQDELRKIHGKSMFELLAFGNTVFMDWETYDRAFVSDLPWYRRFLIWLFPRMYDLRYYP